MKLGILGTIFIILLILKIFALIHISWWLVFLPVLILLAIFIICFLISIWIW